MTEQQQLPYLPVEIMNLIYEKKYRIEQEEIRQEQYSNVLSNIKDAAEDYWFNLYSDESDEEGVLGGVMSSPEEGDYGELNITVKEEGAVIWNKEEDTIYFRPSHYTLFNYLDTKIH